MNAPSELAPNDSRLKNFRPPICPRCNSCEGFHFVEVDGSGSPEPILLLTVGIWAYLARRRDRKIHLQCERCQFVFRPKRRFTKGDFFAVVAFLALAIVSVVYLSKNEQGPWSTDTDPISTARPETDPIIDPQPPEPTRPVNVNTATLEELRSIPYISARVDQAIIDNRPYVALEDLKRVPGIKDRMLERIRPFVTLEEKSADSSAK